MTAEAGGRIILASWVGTGLFATASATAVVATGTRDAVAVIDLVLFGLGCAAMLGGFARAVDRSRNELVSVPGVWFLAGSAPTGTRWHLLGSTAAQAVVAVAAASMRPFTPLAFGILVPMFGLGLTGLWGARFGTFETRQQSRQP
jgi:hypothetical protein